jgi:serine/threonine protein kinase
MLIKCYLQHSRYIKSLYGPLYFQNELGIFKPDGSVEYIDVALSHWVDGIPLSDIMEDPDANHHALSYNFDELAIDTLTSTRIHSDIKPDNIIMRPDGSMVLIDNDALLIGKSTIYASPNRARAKYDRRTPKEREMGALRIISTMLAAMAHNFSATIGYVEDGLFVDDGGSARFMRTIDRCRDIFESVNDEDHYAIATMLIHMDYKRDRLYEHLKNILDGRR